MEPQPKKLKKNYATWNNCDRMALIQNRIEDDNLFTGKNANTNEAWRKVADALQQNNIFSAKDGKICKNQWNNLVRKYKSFFKYKTGEGTLEEAMSEEPEDWPFFEVLHQFALKKDNYHPAFLIDSGSGVYNRPVDADSPIVLQDQPEFDQRTTSHNCMSPSSPLHTEQLYHHQTIQRDSRSTNPSQSRPNRNDRLASMERFIKKRCRKVDKRISSMLLIFGQVAQTLCPEVDTTSLILTSESDSE